LEIIIFPVKFVKLIDMASYTDIIPQFTPYVSETPVQALVEVGMEKQRRYDEGIQKIQSYVDQVAGLPVSRPVDRAYLQSKLNELGGKLKTFAAADFSNYQLVNSVNGMTSQLIRDPYLTAGVQSAANIRRQQEFIDEEKKKGTLNPANLTNYQKQLNKYYNAGLKDEDGSPIIFNYDYKQFFDVDKFAKEQFDAAKPDGYTYTDLFTTDEKGRKVLSPTMIKLKREGLFPKKVEEVIDNIFSDPRVRQQLAIDGEYNYGGYGTEDLVKRVDSLKDIKLKSYNDELLQLNIKKAAGEDVDKQIEDVTKYREQISKSFSDIAGMASTNPDAVRSFLETEETKDNFRGTFGYVKEDRDVTKNYAYEAQVQREQFAAEQAYKYYALRVQQSENQKNRENARAIAMLNAAKKNKRDTDGDGIPDEFGGEDVTEAPYDVDADVVSQYNDKVSNTIDTYRNSVDELIFNTALNGTGAQKRYNELVAARVSPAEARSRIINRFAKDNGESPDAFRARWYTKSLDNLNKNPNKLDPTMKKLLASTQNAKDKFDMTMSRASYVDEIKPGDIDKILKTAKTIEYDWSTPLASLWNKMTGKKGSIKVTPQMQLDMALVIAGDNILQDKALRNKAAEARKRLSAQGIDDSMAFTFMNDMIGTPILGKYRDPQEWAEKAARLVGAGGITISDVLSRAKAGTEAPNWIKEDKNRSSFYNMVKSVLNPQNIQTLAERAKRIKEVFPINPKLESTILTGDTEVDRALKDKVASILSSYASTGMNESPGFADNVGAMTNIALGEAKGFFKIEADKNNVNGRVTPKIKFYDASSKPVGEVTISEREARSLGKDPSSWFPSDNVGDLMATFSYTGNGTTAKGGQDKLKDPMTYRVNDALGKRFFPQLQGYPGDVKANIGTQQSVDEFGNPYTSYFLYLYTVKDNGKPIVKPVERVAYSLEEVNEIMRGITPQHIEMLKAETR